MSPFTVLLLSPLVQAADLLQVDAAAPGMSAVVNILRDTGGFTGAEIVTTSCADITVSPARVFDGVGDPSSPVPGGVLSAVFVINDDASPASCTVEIDGVPLEPLGPLDNLFDIVEPLPCPVDGGVGDVDGTEDGTLLLDGSLRSDGGVYVLDSLDVPAGTTLRFDTSDPDAASDGNPAFLPVVVLVVGDAYIEGEVNVSGEDGGDAGSGGTPDDSVGDGGFGGSGGPGGGGGGGGGPHALDTSSLTVSAHAGPGGSGYAGGSAGNGEGTSSTAGGVGVGATPADPSGGGGPFGKGGGGAPTSKLALAGTGGSGNPFGTGGEPSSSSWEGGAGGFGGGGGSVMNFAQGGGGGGGFCTDGADAYSGSDSLMIMNSGHGGMSNGQASLLFLAGGSGGAGGQGYNDYLSSSFTEKYGGGGGGGGGGTFVLVVSGDLDFDGSILADGGDGGDSSAYYYVGAGGGGSGGAIFLASSVLSLAGELSVHGASGGRNPYYTASLGGDGGEGRIRVDGAAPPTPVAGPTGALATTFQGCAVIEVEIARVTVSSAEPCDYVGVGVDGAETFSGTVGADGTVDLSLDLLDYPGNTLVFFSVDGVYSPVGVAWIGDQDADGVPDDADICPDAADSDQVDADTDGLGDACDACTDVDTDGYADQSRSSTPLSCGADCDDADPAIHPDASETWYDELDQDCDGNDDDQDGDGWGVDQDCDDTDASTYPGAPGWTEDCEPVVDTGDSADSGGDVGDSGDTTAAVDTAPDGDTGPSARPKDGGLFIGCGGCATSGASGTFPWMLVLAGLVLRIRHGRRTRIGCVQQGRSVTHSEVVGANEGTRAKATEGRACSGG